MVRIIFLLWSFAISNDVLKNGYDSFLTNVSKIFDSILEIPVFVSTIIL